MSEIAENNDCNGSFCSQITLLPIVKLRIQPRHHHSLHFPHDSPRQVPKDRLDLVAATRRMLVEVRSILHQLILFINEHKDMLTQQQQQQKHLNGSQSADNDIITHIGMTSRSFIY